MMTPILATKFRVPAPRADLVSRPRLLRKLSEGLVTPLTLISAPAGFGKTTLIAEWHHSLAGRDLALAWFSIEAEDNDPVRFLSCLASALEALRPGLVAEAEVLVQSALPKVALAALIHCLNSISHPYALVLEDYHLITASEVHDTVAYLSSHLPAQMRLVISSRIDPPLPLSRLRVRGDLMEIRADDLRFTREETSAYLNQVMGLALSPQDIDALETRTEGWIAGLKLAALSMQNDPNADLSTFASEFAGSHHYIADYLVEEVLNGLPDQVRNFLLQTSISTCLCGELCDAITGQRNGQAMLEQLEQENMFIVRLDDDREWFRYHHLFVELLRHHLNRLHPGLEPELRRRVALWYAENEMPEHAIEEALIAREYEMAARWVEQIRSAMIESGEIETLARWDQALAAYAPPGEQVLLTRRESEVLGLMGKGASNREIARALVVTTGTVKKHLNNIFAKLQAQNRTQAVARARELRLL
jgi:LuxR family maltose regulon positive regulatory protein